MRAQAEVQMLPLGAVAFYARCGVDEQPQMVLIDGLRFEDSVQMVYAIAFGGRGRWVPLSAVQVALARVPVFFCYEE